MKMEELNELRVVVEKSGMEISDIIQMAQMRQPCWSGRSPEYL